MIRIGNLSLPLEAGEEGLRKRAARALGVRPGALGELEMLPPTPGMGEFIDTYA